jgi:hypothetical protein
LQPVHHLVGLQVALGAPCRFLRQIATEVRHIRKMKPRLAGCAVSVVQQDFLGAPEQPLAAVGRAVVDVCRCFLVLRGHGLLSRLRKPHWLTLPVSAGPRPF